MYIAKRWLLPTMLSCMLLAGIAVVAVVALRPVETRTVQLTRETTPAPVNLPMCPPAPAPVPAAVSVQAPRTNTAPSRRDTQLNIGGFGDIGMQFQNVGVFAPITAIDIKNFGDNNSNKINVGDGNAIVDNPPPDPQPAPEPAATPTTAEPTTPTTSGTSSAPSSTSPAPGNR
jgi:hypothetical protein